jgi:hypothetical protein
MTLIKCSVDKNMKFIGKVILAFVIWVLLGSLLTFVYPNRVRNYGMSTGRSELKKLPELMSQYTNAVTELTNLGFRPAPEINVRDKHETRFTGTYGNIFDVLIDISVGKSPESETYYLGIRAKYMYPQWTDGGSSDHKLLKKKLQSLIAADAHQ